MKVGAAVVVVGFFLVAAFWPVTADRSGDRFTATALNANNQPAGPVEVVIERRSTDGERQRLLESFRQERSTNLIETIQSLPRVGYMRANERMTYELRYADRFNGDDGGERVIIATDRPVVFREAPEQSSDSFTVIELRLNEYGEGQGRMSLVTGSPGDQANRPMTAEDYDVRPLLLMSVRHSLY